MAQAGPATLPRDSGGYEGGRAGEGVRSVVAGAGDVIEGRGGERVDKGENPWKKGGGQNPGADWQPDAWKPRMPGKK